MSQPFPMTRAPAGLYVTRLTYDLRLPKPEQRAYVVAFTTAPTHDQSLEAATLIAHARKLYDVVFEMAEAGHREEFQDLRADARKLLAQISTYRLARKAW